VGHLWQNRFYSCALDEAHLWAALRYVERNPIRAQLVTRPEEYFWSSAAAHVGLGAPPALLDWEFYSSSGGRETMRCTIGRTRGTGGHSRSTARDFQRTTGGCPEFMSNLERQLGPLAPRQGQRTRPESVAAVAL
jgi:hypothetical protein